MDLRALAGSMVRTYLRGQGRRFGRRDRIRIRASGILVVECYGPDGALKDRRAGDVEPLHNLVLDVGLEKVKDRLFNPATTQPGFFWGAIGTGTTAEDAGDTALQTEVARVAGVYTSGGIGVCTLACTFPAGTPVGDVTVTEFGAFDVVTAASGNPWNRKVFAGVPKTSLDVLKVLLTVGLAAE